jgi:hypothetical protein
MENSPNQNIYPFEGTLGALFSKSADSHHPPRFQNLNQFAQCVIAFAK